MRYLDCVDSMKAPTFEEFRALAAAANVRPRFAHTYSQQSKKIRLLDLLTFIATENNPDYLAIPNDGEIAVVDLVRREKAFFAMPGEIPPQGVEKMILEFFGTPGVRVTHCIWIA